MKINQNVWILAGQFADRPLKGVVRSVSNIDNKGSLNTYCDVETKEGIKHVNIILMFDQKPKKTVQEDCYGTFTAWL